MILTSKVYDIAVETPLTKMPRLSERVGGNILLKREDMQPVFSFKLRGAYNMISHLSDQERAQGVITASAGNHAQGVAMSARHLGCRAVIVMPTVTPSIKVNSVRRLGAEVIENSAPLPPPSLPPSLALPPSLSLPPLLTLFPSPHSLSPNPLSSPLVTLFSPTHSLPLSSLSFPQLTLLPSCHSLSPN